jgi:predicted transcriptional regulator of viral defense system
MRASLEAMQKPVVTQFEFFRMIWEMYHDTPQERLYLRSDAPDLSDFSRIRRNLKASGIISSDRDYGRRVIRVLTLSDLPAEDIICLIDPTCYVSHLSAMQRWGLTNRSPSALILTRPDLVTHKKETVGLDCMAMEANSKNPFPARLAMHPKIVRKRDVQIHETKIVGASIKERTTGVRISTVGQTFLDMIQKPAMCGGMGHVLEVWQELASTYFDEIVTAVEGASSGLVKSRAGYILEEQMGLRHETIDKWKMLGQRGSSRRLDPSKPFASTFSETWMISINV